MSFIRIYVCKLLVLCGVVVVMVAAPSLSYAQYAGFGDPGASVGGGEGGLVPVESNVESGEIPTGASAQVVVRFRNDGGKDVETGLIQLYPSSTVSAEVFMNQCEDEPLPTGAECAIAVSVKGLQAGPYRVEMLMSHSGRARLVTATLSGSVAAGADASQNLATDVEAIPNKVEFGQLNASQSLIEPIRLRNITSVPITIKSVQLTTSQQSGYALSSECEVTLGPGEACIAVVSWSPQINGRSSGVVVVKHDGPTGITSIPMSGEYMPESVSAAELFPQAVPGKGLLISSQEEVDFGSGIETDSTMTVSLVNTGDEDVLIKDISLSGSENGLSFKEGGCSAGTILEPIEACPLTVSWSPSREGAVIDDIKISHDGARGVLILPVRGDAEGAVNRDQKAILLSGGAQSDVAFTSVSTSEDISANLDPADTSTETTAKPTGKSTQIPSVPNPKSVLDGYKITSFSRNKAIINGSNGTRLIIDGEETVLGGVPWGVLFQKNGIEFYHKGSRVLMLFDKSLSSVNQNSASSEVQSTDNEE